eukprot:gene28459-31606_t
MYGTQQPVVLFPPPLNYVVPAQQPPTSAGWFMPPPPKFPNPKGAGQRPRDNAGNNKSRDNAGNNKKRKWQNNAGGFDGGPNIHQLQLDNRRKARRHFKGSFGETPRRNVPGAPSHSPSVLLHAPGSVLTSPLGLGGPGFHAMTPNPFKPGTAWKNGLGTVDKEAADIGKTMGIDIFGSNAGLIASKAESDAEGREGDADGSDMDDPFGFELHLGEEVEGPVPASARAQIEEQQAYIAQLEEQSLNLQEKLFIAEQQVKDLQAELASRQPSASEELDHRHVYGDSEDDLQGALREASDEEPLEEAGGTGQVEEEQQLAGSKASGPGTSEAEEQVAGNSGSGSELHPSDQHREAPVQQDCGDVDMARPVDGIGSISGKS